MSMWSALPAYLGGKRRLCGVIFREIDRIVPRARWRDLTLLDGFLGGGSVSLYAKAQGFHVVATDIAERSIVVGRSLVENGRARLTKADVLRVLARQGDDPGAVEARYVPAVFGANVARFVDAALATAAETDDVAKASLIRLLVIKVAMLAHPMSQVRPGTAHRMATGEYEAITETCVRHYVDALKLTTVENLWRLAQDINAGVFAGRGEVHKADILEALPTIAADVAYFDPPYAAVMSYEKEYRVLDEILEGHTRETSPFTRRDGASMIDRLLERAEHIPVWILSFGNAVVGASDLEAKMARFGRKTKALEIGYMHLPAVATARKKAENRELLVIGVDEAAVAKLNEKPSVASVQLQSSLSAAAG
jgi:adenine-specific DNA-methyltransferase